jgi:hypothetical protein
MSNPLFERRVPLNLNFRGVCGTHYSKVGLRGTFHSKLSCVENISQKCVAWIPSLKMWDVCETLIQLVG